MFLFFFTLVEYQKQKPKASTAERGMVERIMGDKDEISKLSWQTKIVHWNLYKIKRVNVNSCIQKGTYLYICTTETLGVLKYLTWRRKILWGGKIHSHYRIIEPWSLKDYYMQIWVLCSSCVICIVLFLSRELWHEKHRAMIPILDKLLSNN